MAVIVIFNAFITHSNVQFVDRTRAILRWWMQRLTALESFLVWVSINFYIIDQWLEVTVKSNEVLIFVHFLVASEGRFLENRTEIWFPDQNPDAKWADEAACKKIKQLLNAVHQVLVQDHASTEAVEEDEHWQVDWNDFHLVVEFDRFVNHINLAGWEDSCKWNQGHCVVKVKAIFIFEGHGWSSQEWALLTTY